MDILVLLSLIIKGMGSVFEISSQSLISQNWGVEAYGAYAFFIAVSEVVYFMSFSGIVKFNNYYIPHNQDVSKFKKKLHRYFVLPVSIIGIAIGAGLESPMIYCSFSTAMLYFFAMDKSSTLLSFGYYKTPLIGEYCIGRLFVVIGVLLTLIVPNRNIAYLYGIYATQFIVITIYLKFSSKKKTFPPLNVPLEKCAIKKYAIFQVNEIANMIIMQSTVIIQYMFGGAFQTAIVSIILVIRKIINFITGPASKLYQPEFSKRFNSGDKVSLAKVYAQITRMQLCFILPLFTFLIVKPEFVLSIYNDSLIEYTSLVRYTSIVFLFMVSFGPLANFLCMTNHEKVDTSSNWASIGIMYAVMIIFRESPYFVIYGFCTQIITSTIYKLYVFIRFMKCFTMPMNIYFRLLAVLSVTILMFVTLQINILNCIAICAFQFIANFISTFSRTELIDLLKKNKKMNKTDLLVIDYNSSGFKRYAVDICKKLKESDSKLKIIAGFAEKDVEMSSPYIDDFISLDKYAFDACKVMDEYKPKAILLFAHRFLEYLFAIEAHKRGIIVLDFQHGFYMDSTIISSLTLNNLALIFRRKSNKIKVYMECLFNICNKSYFVLAKTLIDFIKYRSIYKVMNKNYGKTCNANISFIFGSYWITYYAKQYLATNTEFVIVGYPELEGARMEVPQNDFEDNKLPVVCYLAQTSVEDGVIKKSDLDIFISDLLRSLDKINLVIKLHPRSDKSLYEAILYSEYANHVKIWKGNEFPVTDAYIGHESTVIARALSLTNKVLVYRLKDNRVSPFEQFTEYVSGANGKFYDDFINMLTSTCTTRYKDLNDYVYWNKSQGAIQETANRIYNEIKKDE